MENSVEQLKATNNSCSSITAAEKSPARKKLKEDVKTNILEVKPDPSQSLEPEQTESKTPKVRAINNFFSKLSKEEYRKELKRSTESAVLTVRALVHSPEPPLEPVASVTAPKKNAPLPGKKQR